MILLLGVLMNQFVTMSEMRGMFLATQNPKFVASDFDGGYVLSLDGRVLLTVRGVQHVFRSYDSVVSFVNRHFVVPYLHRARVEIICDPQVQLL